MKNLSGCASNFHRDKGLYGIIDDVFPGVPCIMEWNRRCCEGDRLLGKGPSEEEHRHILQDPERAAVLKPSNPGTLHCLRYNRILVGGCTYCSFYVISDSSSNIKRG